MVVHQIGCLLELFHNNLLKPFKKLRKNFVLKTECSNRISEIYYWLFVSFTKTTNN